jgi:hypothetical protein
VAKLQDNHEAELVERDAHIQQLKAQPAPSPERDVADAEAQSSRYQPLEVE